MGDPSEGPTNWLLGFLLYDADGAAQLPPLICRYWQRGPVVA
jgi:hypothetical protein